MGLAQAITREEVNDDKPCCWTCCRYYNRLGLIVFAIVIALLERRMAGSKTYIVAALTVAYAVGGYLLGYLDATTMMGILTPALLGATIRHGITTEAAK